jgi:hypothetical protein
MGIEDETTMALSSSRRSSPALSKRAKFRDAIVVSAEWSNMAGIGACELALVQGPRSAQVWHWMDKYGPAERVPFGRLLSWRDAVHALASSEEHAACIQPAKVKVTGPKRYIGHILAIAWCDGEVRRTARLLCRLPDRVLASVDSRRNGVFNSELQDALATALVRLDEAMLDLDELPDILDLADAKPATLRKLITKMITEAAAADELRQEAAESKRQAKESFLMPCRARLDEMERRWRQQHHERRYGKLPPVGLIQLMGFAEKHIAERGVLPAGVHTIPGKPDTLWGVVAALTMDFDELLGPDDRQQCTSA